MDRTGGDLPNDINRLMKEKRWTLLEYEMREKAIKACEHMEAALTWWEGAQLVDAHAYKECKKAYLFMNEITASLINSKYNRDIEHEPSEKENLTKGF